jgi:hypothetical protein
MKTHTVIASCLLVASSAWQAWAQTITFDGAPEQPRGTAYAIPEYSESGMVFKPFGPIDAAPPYRLTRNGGGILAMPDNGTAFLQTGVGDSLEFYNVDGSAFSLISVDLAEYSFYFNPWDVTFNGFRSDGTMVSTSFTLIGLPSFQTYMFGPEFSDLIRVEVPTQGYSLDNVVVATVPEPTVTGLSILGSTILTLRARKRNASLLLQRMHPSRLGYRREPWRAHR